MNLKSPQLIFLFILLCFSISDGYRKSKNTTSNSKPVIDTICWTPSAIHYTLYNRQDSLMMDSIVNYDQIFVDEGIRSAYLKIKNDTLFEHVIYDSCKKTCKTVVVFEGQKVHYVKQPLLLSNTADGYKKDEYLIQHDSILVSTISVYFDTLQDRFIKKSVTTVMLKKTSEQDVITDRKAQWCRE